MSHKQALKRLKVKQHNEAYAKMRLDDINAGLNKANVELSQVMHEAVAADISPDVETKELIETEKKLISPEEYAKEMGRNKIPRFPVNARTYQVRKMFKQLTKQELQDEAKAVKINRGVQKMEALLARAGV